MNDRYKLPFEEVKRNIFEKKQTESSGKFGKHPEERTTEEHITFGVVNIDKPKGPTSHQVSAYVQKIFDIKKAGHSGTLDPKVTGVLPVALSQATKVVQALLTAGKEYMGIMHLHKEVDEYLIRKTCADFVGEITQLPPIKSSVKRQHRQRNIYYFEILEIKDKDVLFRVGCQAGTYIRKLCHDIGEKLGGAHMAELRRTKAGPFREDTLTTLQNCTDAIWYWKHKQDDTELRKIVMPVESAVQHLPHIWVLDTTVNALCNGANLKVPGITKLHSGIVKGELIALMTLKGELIALAKAHMTTNEIMKQERGVAATLERVFLPRGTYPQIQKKE
jgi:H/ACA ribonucleoprotein complex subunit 4